MAAYNIIPSSSSSSFTTITITLSPSSLSVSDSGSSTSSSMTSPKFTDSFDATSAYSTSTSTSSFGELVEDKNRCFRKLTKNVWFEDASTFEWTAPTTTLVLDTGVLCESPESVHIEAFESVQPAQVAGIEHGPAFRRSSTTSSFRNPILDEEEIMHMCEVSKVAQAAVEVSSPVSRASSLSSVSSKKSKIGAWIRRALRV